MNERPQRRLAAIVAADIVGYSRLMAEDEEGTLSRVQYLRDHVTEPTIEKHGGRIVKRTGDGTLVEFSSVIGAARAALDVQHKLHEHQADSAGAEPIVLRIGINLGDVLIEDEDIFGDGVNIAARLEQLCVPGEVMISGSAFDQLEGRSEFSCAYLGEQQLKNIARPVRAYRLSPFEELSVEENTVSTQGDKPMAQSLPDKPSIVVLPFNVMSFDPDQEFFCDGMCEDITTALSRFSNLFVIARNTAFTFKGTSVNVRVVSRELGVQYVLEGSSRFAGNRIRVNAQLIDAVNDRHVWAAKVDSDLEDIFSVQDEIVKKIVGAVAPEIEADVIAKTISKPAVDLSDHENIYRANWHLAKYTPEDNLRAEEICQSLIERNPDLAEAYTFLAWGYGFDALYAWNRPAPESLKLSLASAQNAISRDPGNAFAHTIHGAILFSIRRHEQAIAALNRAIEINPNQAVAFGFLGMVQSYTHDFDSCFQSFQEALRLSPRDPMRALFVANIGQAYFNAGDYRRSIEPCQAAMSENPRMPSAVRALAAAYGMLGELEKAAEAYRRLNQLIPGTSLTSTRGAIGFAFEDDETRFLEGLRRAGMPE